MTVRPVIISLLITLAACTASPNNRYYTLSPLLQTEQAVNRNWELSAVTIPELLNRPQIILKSGTNNIVIEEYDRWPEPLDGMITRILKDNLTSRMGLDSKVSIPGSEECRISVTIDELDADNDGNVFLSALWMLQTGEVTKSYIYKRSQKTKSSDIQSIVAALSMMLGTFSDAISSQCMLVTPDHL